MMRYIRDMLQKISNLGDSSIHQSTFIYALYASYALVAIAITGVLKIDPSYLQYIETFIKYYVSIFLMARFNPIVRETTKFTAFDAKVAWSAGVFLFITTSAFQLIQAAVAAKATTETK